MARVELRFVADDFVAGTTYCLTPVATLPNGFALGHSL